MAPLKGTQEDDCSEDWWKAQCLESACSTCLAATPEVGRGAGDLACL